MKQQCAEMLIFPGAGAIWACILPALRLGEIRISIPSENLGYLFCIAGMQEKVFTIYPYVICKKSFPVLIKDFGNIFNC